ncbi:multisubstrate pseudouridine synthase 7 [Cladophialophora chaetospira]|uniref:Multisubstrate pseudouridine synthase 7 n=1 Tax=Cladophialophora chaetospira TaxID=386627 RepID=A0AA38X351_9EURO|nr:multisubstrate pseudouridine synthase 7 [Cladophialophora chaetospira]
MDTEQIDSRPVKRIKLDSSQLSDPIETSTTMAEEGGKNGGPASATPNPFVLDDAAKEQEVGIIAFIDESRGAFRGILKKRYTDFLVNEILPNGTVVHLRSTKAKSQNFQSKSEVAVPTADAAADEDKQETSKTEPTVGEAELLKEDVNGAREDELLEPKKTPADSDNIEVALHSPDLSPKLTTRQLSDIDRTKLLEHFNEETVSQMSSLYQSILRHPDWKSRDHPMVRTEFTSDRSIRSQIHQDIRRIFASKLDSSTDKEGILVLTAAHAPSNNHRERSGGWNNKPNNTNNSFRPNKLSWQDRGGEYLHFSLYKENKDTLEVISYLTRELRTNGKIFQFAGTKDRRAVTVQRVSAHRIDAGRLAGLNRTLRYAAVGDFEYQEQGLELGDLSGNEFVITLRDCHIEGPSADALAEQKAQLQSYIAGSLQQLHDRGFLNFYGLQRFGTFATRTDVVGLKILQGDFKGACDAILDFSPLAINAAESEIGTLIGRDDRSRAEGINVFCTTGRVNEALDKIPRKFGAEINIIRHLGRQKSDFVGALLGIQRNLRLMYVHAYQSLVWNLAVGERWRLYGHKVVEGDLVLVREHKDKHIETSAPKQTVDADGEIIIEPMGEDKAFDKDDLFDRARALTAEEAASGMYTIFDIVLPLPGFDVLYPANASGEWYKTFMTSEAGGGLDPYDMRRKQKDFSLSGSYRKMLARIGRDFEVSVHEYAETGEDKQFVETDLEKIKNVSGGLTRPAAAPEQRQAGEAEISATEQPSEKVEMESEADKEQAQQSTPLKFAAVLKFQLGSSQYATMALRELSKGGIQAYKAEFMGGR